jgi:hypothetical protein
VVQKISVNVGIFQKSPGKGQRGQNDLINRRVQHEGRDQITLNALIALIDLVNLISQ